MVPVRHQSAGQASLPGDHLRHRDINSTLIYITVTKELLQEASERFRVVGAHCLDPLQEERP
jgi:hypothetical protein